MAEPPPLVDGGSAAAGGGDAPATPAKPKAVAMLAEKAELATPDARSGTPNGSVASAAGSTRPDRMRTPSASAAADPAWLATKDEVRALPASAKIRDFLMQMTDESSSTCLLSFHTLTDEDAALMAKCLRLAPVCHTVRLHNNTISLEQMAVLGAALANTVAVANVELRGAYVDGPAFKALLGQLSVAPRLRSIRVLEGAPGPEGMKAVCDLLRSNATLEELDLSRCDIAETEDLTAAILVNRGLRKLTLASNSIGPTAAGQFAPALLTGTSLRVVNLRQNPIGDDGICDIADAVAVSSVVTVLDVSSCHIGARGAGSLSRMLKFDHSLFLLNISDNPLGDLGIARLAEGLKFNRGIQQLYVQDCGFGAHGARMLAAAIAVGGGAKELHVAPVDDDVLDEELQSGYAARDQFVPAPVARMPSKGGPGPTSQSAPKASAAGATGAGEGKAIEVNSVALALEAEAAKGEGGGGVVTVRSSTPLPPGVEAAPLAAHRNDTSFGKLTFPNGDTVEVHELHGTIARGTYRFNQRRSFVSRLIIFMVAFMSWADYVADVAVIVHLAADQQKYGVAYLAVSLGIMVSATAHTVWDLYSEGRYVSALLQFFSAAALHDAVPVITAGVRRDVAVDVLRAIPMVGAGSVTRLKLTEALTESGMQAVLQISLGLHFGFEWVFAASACVSLVSVGIGFAATDRAAFQEHTRRRLGKNALIKWASPEFALVFFFRLSEAVARIGTVALLVAVGGVPALGAIVVLVLCLQWAMWALGGQLRSHSVAEHLKEIDWRAACNTWRKDLPRILTSTIAFPGFHHMCLHWLQTERQASPSRFIVVRFCENAVMLFAIFIVAGFSSADVRVLVADGTLLDGVLFETLRWVAVIAVVLNGLSSFGYWLFFNDDVLLKNMKYHDDFLRVAAPDTPTGNSFRGRF